MNTYISIRVVMIPRSELEETVRKAVEYGQKNSKASLDFFDATKFFPMNAVTHILNVKAVSGTVEAR